MSASDPGTPHLQGHSWSEHLPVRGWFFALPAAALKPGCLRGFDALGHSLVLYRGQDGQARAVSAHCPHYGTHFRHGRVEGNALRCALHGWTWQAGCLQPYPIAEVSGGLWVCLESGGRRAGEPDVSLVDPPGYAFRPGKPVFLEAPWQAVLSNGFDMLHFGSVHRREVLEHRLERQDGGHSLHLEVLAAVTGTGWHDRVMKAVSGNRIRIGITCQEGPLVTVHASTRLTASCLRLSALPQGSGTLVTPVFGIPRRHVAWPLQLRLTAWLYRAFLRQDVQLLQGVKFAPDTSMAEDACFGEYLRFVAERVRRAGGAG